MKSLWKRYDIALILFVLGSAFVGFIWYETHNTLLTASTGAVFSLCVIIKIIHSELYSRKLYVRAKRFSELLGPDNKEAFENLKISCCLIDSEGNILWCNPYFLKAFEIKASTPDTGIKDLLDLSDIEGLKKGEGYSFNLGKRWYTVNSCVINISDDERNYLLYFFDETEFIELKKRFRDTRPVIIHTIIDNAGDIYDRFKESECTAVFSVIEQEIYDWAAQFGVLCRKYSSTRMLILGDEQALQKMIANKFSVLERIRGLTYSSQRVDVTLSVGIGHGGSLEQIFDFSRQALDMSQSRGGDQVSIKDAQKYTFFGGISEGKEQKNKVKTRYMAKAVSEHIRSAEKVIVMGHRFSDFDAFGSAAGICCLAKNLGVPAYICVDRTTSLAGAMIDQYVAKFGFDVVVSPERARQLANEKTLVVVTDTHKRDFTECPELLDDALMVMVIDHHRKSVDFIDNTVLFYHRPNSSSASEMVAELLEYSEPKSTLDPVTAQAMLAGIMLDTRGFVLRCNVRTFEAAAYLRGCSANTVSTKKLFSSDMELFRKRNAVIDSAVKYKNCCAIAVADFESPNIRLITSQAADEMLNIEDVKSSYVLYKNGTDINISARSYGEMNVQLIMETLGGGGHQAMSACQLHDTDFDSALEKLHQAIDTYFEEN